MQRPAIVLTVLGITGMLWWLNRPAPAPLALATVDRGRVESTIYSLQDGVIEACQRARLSPIAGGRITYIGIKQGARVRKGEVLLRLSGKTRNNRELASGPESGRTVLLAPFDGVVASVISTGEEADMAPPVVNLIDDSCLYVDARMDESEAGRVKIGQTANVMLPKREKPVAGQIKRIAPYILTAEGNKRTVNVEIVLEHKQTRADLLVGHPVGVNVIPETHENVLRIPTSALREQSSALVYRKETRQMEPRQIVTGIGNREYTEILEGLMEGEHVATTTDTPVSAHPLQGN